MAITISIDSELDVLDKYSALIEQSLSSSSMYIRTKETLQELLIAGDIKAVDKAKVISEVLNNLNGTLVSSSMSTALQWSSKEKEIALGKLELGRKLELLDKEAIGKVKEIERLTEEVNLLGKKNLDYASDRTKDRALKQAQIDKFKKEEVLLVSRERESQASVHKIIADTYVNYGRFTYTLGPDGVSNVIDGTPIDHITLSDKQAKIATQQAKGYAYNAWGNSVTGSASVLGALIGSGAASFGAGSDASHFLSTIKSATDKLKNVTPP